MVPLPDSLADGALTTVAAKVRPADDPPTEKNSLNPSKPEYSSTSKAWKTPVDSLGGSNPAENKKKNSILSDAVLSGCGGRIWTYDLRVMRSSDWPQTVEPMDRRVGFWSARRWPFADGQKSDKFAFKRQHLPSEIYFYMFCVLGVHCLCSPEQIKSRITCRSIFCKRLRIT